MAEIDKTEESLNLKALIGDIMDIVEAVVLSIFIIVMAFAYLLRPVIVDGSSMLPTLYNEDRLIMWSFGYEPKTGDIIIVDDAESGHFTDETETEVVRSEGLQMTIVKRCIAVGGQTVNIDASTGAVSVDGVVLDEPYISAPTMDSGDEFMFPITIPEGYIFAMGDNRPGSTDSRFSFVALIPEEQVLGHAILRLSRNAENCTKWTDQFAILWNK